MRRAAAALVFVALAVVGSACGGDEEYRTLSRRECLPAEAKVVGRREADPPTVDCDEPHRYEVYGVGTIDGPRAFPGQDEVDAAARQECYELFAPNVGYDAALLPDDVKVLYLNPSESSWNDQDDREVECLLVFDGDRRGATIPDRPQPTSTTTAVEEDDA